MKIKLLSEAQSCLTETKTPFLSKIYRPWYVLAVLVVLMFGSANLVIAQTPDLPTTVPPSAIPITVSGVVSNAAGETLPGVSILIQGTTTGVVSDMNGAYTLSAPADAILVFSYIGYGTQQISINNLSSINITLAASNTSLDEVVVIGYQSVKRSDLTGATGIVDTRNTERIVTRSVPEALQGMAAGVSVRNGGAPGQEAVVNIRGLGTFGNANPLYVIDGMFTDPNTTINPNDVESIQILKDASAAAIYGSRAGNGVIIITTKKGRNGPPKIAISSRYSISTVPKRYDMMNGTEYAANNTLAYNNYNATATPSTQLPIQPGIASYTGQTNTNWADELLQTGALQDHNASISGGTQNSSYLISGGYFTDKGTLKSRNFDRASLRINTQTTAGRFTFGQNMAVSTSTANAPFQGGAFAGNPWVDAFTSLPNIAVRDPSLISNSNPGGWGYGSNASINTFARNQVAIADITHTRTNFTKIFGNAFMDFKILEGLTYRFNAGLETSFDKSKSIRKEGSWYQNQSTDLSRLTDNRSQFTSYLFEHTLNFNKTLGKHSINGVVGYTEQTTKTDNTLGEGVRLANLGGNYFTTLSSTSGLPGNRTASGTASQHLMSSVLSRLNYNYADRYLLTLTFRSDKDSRFSPDFKTGYFPSAALAWRISNEDFFKSNLISDLKLRGSYGSVGINTLGTYQYTGFLNQAPSYVFGPGQQVFSGATQARIVAERIKWETKRTANIGADIAFMQNSLRFSVDAFRAISSDVLVELPLPQYLGNLQGNPIQNSASVQNQGLEFEINYKPNSTNAFQWDIGANLSIIRNKVLGFGSLGIDEATGLPKEYIQSGNTRTQVGRSIGEYYVLKADGIFQNQAEIDAHKAQAAYAKPGDVRYENSDDKGTNDDIDDADRQFVGSPWPKFTTGMQFNCSYSNFTLTMQLYGAYGQTLYNDVIRQLDQQEYSNYRRDLNPWTPTNTSTDDPRLGTLAAPSDRGTVENARGNTSRWLENGSFLRLRNLELGYNIPTKWFGKANISNARVYVSTQNLFTITKYRGLDPDVVGANASLEPGVDNGNYPSSRIVSFGIGLGF